MNEPDDQLPPAMQQQAQFAARQAPPEMPFTTADNIQLQKLYQAQSQVQEQLGSGLIDDQTAGAHRDNINRQLIPLQQKQERHMAKQAAQAEQQLADQSLKAAALQEGVNKVHKISRARSLPEEVGKITDPVSGVTSLLIQDDKGNWKEVKHEAHQAEEDRLAQRMQMATGEAAPSLIAGGAAEPGAAEAKGGQRDWGMIDPETNQPWNPKKLAGLQEAAAQGKGQGLQNKYGRVDELGNVHIPGVNGEPVIVPGATNKGNAGLQGTMGRAPAPRAGVALAGQPEQISAPSLDELKQQAATTGEPITLDQLGQALRQTTQPPQQAAQPAGPQILNAAGEDITNATQPTRGQRDEWGRPTGGGGNDAFAEMYRRADASIPRLRPGATHAEILHRADAVNHLAHRQLDRLSQAQIHREDLATKEQAQRHALEQKSHDAEALQKQKAADAMAKLQEARGEHGLSAKDKLAHIHQIETTLDKQAHDWSSNVLTSDKPLPEHLRLENRDAEIQKRLERSMRLTGSGAQPPEQGGPPPGGLTKEQAAQPSNVPVKWISDTHASLSSGIEAALKTPKPNQEAIATMQAMQSILAKAKGGGMNLGQRAQYEQFTQKLKQLEAGGK